MNRIKSIDGLRAVSIIMVLLRHGVETMPAILTNNYVFETIANSSLGVNIFFVISGYLITKLLIIEKQKKGEVSLKHFYIRRVFRIFPLFYLYILVILVLKLYFIPGIVSSYTSFVFAGLFLWNSILAFHFNPGEKGGWFLGHFWTLAMEEQFYMVWPLMFKLSANRQSLTRTVFIIILLMPVLRVITYILVPAVRPQIGLMLPTGGDAILIGCLGALVETQADFKERYFRFIQNKWLVYFAFLFLLILGPLLSYYLRGGYGLLFGMSFNNIAILLILLWSIYVPSVFANLLNSKVMIQIGILSYSIYIWQQLFLTPRIDTWFNKFPQNIVVVFVVAVLSYNLVEKPILKLKNRFKGV